MPKNFFQRAPFFKSFSLRSSQKNESPATPIQIPQKNRDETPLSPPPSPVAPQHHNQQTLCTPTSNSYFDKPTPKPPALVQHASACYIQTPDASARPQLPKTKSKPLLRNQISPQAPASNAQSSDSTASSDSVAQKHLEKYHLHPDFAARYSVLDELGSGGFGFVVTALRHEDEVEVAVKFIFKNKVPIHGWAKDKQLGVIPMEAFILKNIRHKNIVAFLDFYEDNKFYYLVMELHGAPWTTRPNPAHVPNPVSRMQQARHTTSDAPKLKKSKTTMNPPSIGRIGRRHSMDLFECIETHSKISEKLARKIFVQVADAVRFLGHHGVVHRDLKDENVVIDQNYHVKLIDFGSAAFVPKSGRLFDRFAGTLQYCPPEVLKGEKYRGPEQEVWALGVLLYTILFGEAPFADPIQAMQSDFLKPRFKVSQDCMDLLNWMLQKHPRNRANIDQVMSHPWVVTECGLSGVNGIAGRKEDMKKVVGNVGKGYDASLSLTMNGRLGSSLKSEIKEE
ncbi:kinase-like domain-containing protein [Paraphysoderma sedebokerense]|nr:kinase-like domain-containing protein [Paraphysoderma sedebokerense]